MFGLPLCKFVCVCEVVIRVVDCSAVGLRSGRTQIRCAVDGGEGISTSKIRLASARCMRTRSSLNGMQRLEDSGR